VPAALKAMAGKDAGPPAPHLDDAALAALKAQLSGSKAGSKPAPDAAAKPVTEAGSASVPLPESKPSPEPASTPGTQAGSASAAEAVPLPDHKPH